MNAVERKNSLLVAVVRAGDKSVALEVEPSLKAVESGSLVALTCRAIEPDDDWLEEAILHDRIMGKLAGACSALVPFRLGVRVDSDNELRRFLRTHGTTLGNALRRFEGRGEMGIKIKARDGHSSFPNEALGSLRALARNASDCRERHIKRAGVRMFEGAYLIAATTIEDFWSEVDALGTTLGGFAILGTGPWAPYSFSDLELDWAGAMAPQES